MAVLNLQTAQFTTNTNPYTLSSYTPASGSNRVLVVRVHGLKGDDTSDFPVSSVTFGGVNLTEAVTLRQTSTSRGYRTAIWYLVNPSSSAGNIVVTFGSGGIGCIISAVTLTDIDQTTPLGVTKTDTSVPNAYGYGSTTTAPTAGSTIIGAVTSHCGGNQTWTWFDSGSAASEEYDIRAASNTNAEVAGSGGYVIDLQPASTLYYFGSSQTGTNPQSSCAAEFLPASTGITVELDTLSAAAAAVALGVVPGAVSVLLDVLAAALSAVDLSVVPGVATVLLDTLAAQLAALDLSVVPGSAAVVLDTLALTGSAQDLIVVPGGVAIVLTTLEADTGVISLLVVPGEATISLDTLGGTLAAVSLIVSAAGTLVTVVLSTLDLTGAAIDLTVVPGEVAIALNTLAAILAAIGLNVSTEGVIQIIQLATLALQAGPQALAVVPGAVAIELQTLSGELTLVDLTVFLMLGCALAADRGRYGAILADALRYYATASDRTGCN